MNILEQAVAGFEEAFFAAMQNGYAKGSSKATIPELPGSKVITFNHGVFTVKDCYMVADNSAYSFGTTFIWIDRNPKWMMQYQGWYDKDVIPFLKRALMQNYSQSQFVGGRGPIFFTEKQGLVYTNTPDLKDFSHFRGREEIWDTNHDKCFGWHEYQGMFLTPLGEATGKVPFGL